MSDSANFGVGSPGGDENDPMTRGDIERMLKRYLSRAGGEELGERLRAHDERLKKIEAILF